MRSYTSLIGNGSHMVGCTGQTVYLMDSKGTEIAKFRDLKYAYLSAISPRGDIFAVKSCNGQLAVYSISPPRLIKDFRYSKVDCSQDDNFCFSPDGSELYSVERHGDSTKTALSVYDTRNFTLKKRILGDDPSLVLSGVEFEPETGRCFLLGFTRDDKGVADLHFTGILSGSTIEDTVYIPEKEASFYEGYLILRMSGFSVKAYELFRHFTDKETGLEELRSAGHTLAGLWSRYRGQAGPDSAAGGSLHNGK